MTRRRLTAAQREALYDVEAAKALANRRGEYPICIHCDNPIVIGQRWHVAHDPRLPHAIGGKVCGLAHADCNQLHNNDHDTPLIAKVKRQRRKHIGAIEPKGSIRGGRNDPWKRTVDGRVIDRMTGEAFKFGSREGSGRG